MSLAIPMFAALGSGLATAAAADRQNDIAQSQFFQNLQFQRYQYEDMKRYQAPKNQVRMLREAGINPALAYYGGFSPTSVSSVGGVSPTASATSPDFNSLPSAASNLLGSLSQNDVNKSVIDVNQSQAAKNIEQTKGEAIDNLYRNQDWMRTLEGKAFSNAITKTQGSIAAKELEYQDKVLGDRIEQMKWQSEYWRANASSALMAAKYAEPQYQMQLRQGLSTIFMQYATGQATLKQAHTDMLRMYAQYGADDESRKQFWRASLNLLEQQFEESKSKEFSNISSSSPLPLNNARWNQYEDWRNGGQTTTGGSMHKYKHRKQTGGVR